MDQWSSGLTYWTVNPDNSGTNPVGVDTFVDMDYKVLKKKLPRNIIPAYDGLSLII